ncbi:MAG: hypothetical protein H6682_07705 [Candidatus Eisenbacteria bacterium]|nr:hypothetical protein [Candidatus Eisenbacteria bacterium]
MKRLERPAFFLIALGLLAAVSCSDKETRTDTPTEPEAPGDPADPDSPDFTRDGVPILPYPAALIQPNFASADSLVRYARGFVEGQYNRVRLLTRAVNSAHGVFNSGAYSYLDANCRTRHYGSPSDSTCGFTVTICESTGGFLWVTSATGTCGPDREYVSGHQVTRGTTDDDGSSGTFESYSIDHNGVEESWRWDLAPDRREGTWTFYQGVALPSNERGRLYWNETDETTLRGEFQWNSGERWSLEIEPNGASGKMTREVRTSGSLAWSPREQVEWITAHGTWTQYAADGTFNEESW